MVRQFQFDLGRFAAVSSSTTVLEDVIAADIAERTSRELAQDSYMARLVSDLVTCVMQKEREIKRELQARGIVAARARGVKFGRKRKMRPDGFEAVRDEWASGHISAREAGRKLNIAHATFLKWARDDLAAMRAKEAAAEAEADAE